MVGGSNRLSMISVVTVCLNSEEFIEQCIDSVLSQNCQDFEYVIIDGGSTDGTVEIIRKHQKKLAYWQSEKDSGVSAAWNLGIEHSKGNWLLFLNSDDYLLEADVLAEFAERLVRYPEADVVFGQVFIVTREKTPSLISGPHGRTFAWQEFILCDLIPHPAALMNRQYFQRVGLFSEDFRIAADYEHFLRGGPSLNAIFVPVRAVCMRDGGLSKRSVKESLLEGRKAQVVTGALPWWRASMQYYLLVSRAGIGRMRRQFKHFLGIGGKHGFS